MPPLDDIPLARHVREEARWLILRMLYMARPVGTSESIMLKGLVGAELPVTANNVRVELCYLEDKHLIVFSSKKTPNWQCKITSYGVDVVEYAKDAPVGIARPEEG